MNTMEEKDVLKLFESSDSYELDGTDYTFFPLVSIASNLKKGYNISNLRLYLDIVDINRRLSVDPHIAILYTKKDTSNIFSVIPSEQSFHDIMAVPNSLYLGAKYSTFMDDNVDMKSFYKNMSMQGTFKAKYKNIVMDIGLQLQIKELFEI